MKKFVVSSIVVLLLVSYIIVANYFPRWESATGDNIVGGVCYYVQSTSCPPGNSTSWCDSVVCVTKPDTSLWNCPVSGQTLTQRKVLNYGENLHTSEIGHSDHDKRDIFCHRQQTCTSSCGPVNNSTNYFCLGSSIQDDSTSKKVDKFTKGTLCP